MMLYWDGGRPMWWFNMYIKYTSIPRISILSSIWSDILDFYRYIHFYFFIWNEILYPTDSNRCITLNMLILPTKFFSKGNSFKKAMANTYKQGRCSKSTWAISFSLSQVLNIRQELLCEQLARIQYDDMTGCKYK